MTALEAYTEHRFQWDMQAYELASKWTNWAAAYALAVSAHADSRILSLTDQLADLTLQTEELVDFMPEVDK